MYSVLIVEDEKIMRDDLLSLIDWKSEGFEIAATAVNGKQALKLYEERHPQLVITDIRMPVMSGLDLLKEIRALNPGAVMVLLTAYDDFSYVKDALRLGASDYILKSELSTDSLREKLKEMANRIKAATEDALGHIQAEIYQLAEDEEELLNTSLVLTSVADRLRWLPKEEFEAVLLPFILNLISSKYAALNRQERYTPPECTDAEEVLVWLSTQVNTLHAIQRGIYDQRLSPVVVNAIGYINRHYMNPSLKTEEVANQVGMSKSRLSVLFKQEVGCTINEHVTAVRIKAAQQLLISGRYKVYEISEMVGYKTSQYFSQIFFQTTGRYPNKYRKEV